MQDSGFWRGRLRRWRWVIAAVLLLVVFRVALPAILRKVIVSQASQNLRAQVDLGNVDLYLWRGGVVLEDFALRPLPASVAGAPGAVTPDTEAAAEGGAERTPPPLPPIIAWKRLSLGLRFRPLWNKTIQLYEATLEAPHIALDRLATGELNVLTILPSPTPSVDGTPAPAGASSETATVMPTPAGTPSSANPPANAAGWRFGIDRVAIGEGKLVFRDLMMADSEPVEVGIPSVEVNDIALDPSVYGGPLNSRVKVLLDEGSLELGARVHLGDKTSLEAELEAKSLPLRRSRLYVPDVGWSDLRGLLDASLRYQLDVGVKNELRGTVGLRDVSVSVPSLPDAALAWKSFTVQVDPVDLVAQQATVAAVDLSGVRLTVRPRSGDTLPVLERRRPAAGEATPTEAAPADGAPPEPNAAPTPETSPPPAAEAERAPAKPWHWSLASLRLSDSLVRLLTDAEPLDVGLALEVKDLADQGEQPASVDLQVAVGGGSIAVQGNTRIAPPGFGGTITLRDLSIPELIAASGAMPDSPLRSARLQADIAVGAGMPAPKAAGAVGPTDLRLSGKISLADVKVVPPGMSDLDVGARTIGLTIKQLDLPGALAPPAGDGDAAPPPPDKGDVRLQGELALAEPRVVLRDGKEFIVGAKAIQLALNELELPGLLAPSSAPGRPLVAALRELRLDAPVVRITRTEKGLVLPGPPPAENAKSEPAAAPPASPAPQAESAGKAPAPAAPVQFSLATFHLSKGQIDIADSSVKPPFKFAVSALEIQARDIRWPDLALHKLRLTAHTPGNGEIELQGDLAASGGTIEFNGRQIDLPSLNPYAVAYSPFRIAGGAATLSTKMSYKGEAYDINNSITLHQFDLSGKEGESLFEKEFGVPLSTALALLRDMQGDIAMDIPVKMDREGTKIDVVGIAGQALRRALVNALTSPLKLLGAVTGSGDKVASIAPAAVAFPPGRSQPSSAAEQRLQQLGVFLASRPALAVELETQVTAADVRWLHEQALRRTWEDQGFFASVLALVQGDTRDRVRDALDARAEGKKTTLSDEDAKALDEWLTEVPQVPEETLAALANDRLSRAGAIVLLQAGVDEARVVRVSPPTEVGDGDPEVRVRLKPATPDTSTSAPSSRVSP